MKKMLVTGGAGFIGTNFIKYMIGKHADLSIVNIDALTYAGNLENLCDIADHNRYFFIKGDITDQELVKDLFTKHEFEYVVNFAAESHVDRSIKNPGIFVKTNILGTQTLLDNAMHSWKTGEDSSGCPSFREGVKYLQVSTDEVYGSLGSSGLFLESTPIQPNSPYSASKASADLLVRAYYKTYKMPVVITRCSNNYGPYQFPEKLIPLMISNALEDKPLPVYGDGLQIRDWLHVSDHCRAIDVVLHQGKTGEVYNVGGNNEKANIDIVKIILGKLNKSEKLIRFITDRLGHDRRYAIDNTKISNELGWKPLLTFEQGLEQTIQWYVNNQDWKKRVCSGEYVEYYNNHYLMKDDKL